MAGLPRVLGILDVATLRRPPLETLESWASGGLRWVQLRDKRASEREFFALARTLAARCVDLDVTLFVNDRVSVAAVLGTGVHVGQSDLPVDVVRRLLGADALIGATADSLADVAVLSSSDAAYVAVGPVFGTRTKEDAGEAVGLDFVRAARRLTTRPLVAIGGIDANRAPEVWRAGADCVAMAGALGAVDDAQAAAKDVVARARQMDSRSERM